MVKVDSFSLLQAITYLASRLSDEFEIRSAFPPVGAGGWCPDPDLVRSGDEHQKR